MTTTTAQPQAPAVYDPAALYAKWTESAKHTRWSYKNERITEFNRAMSRAEAWENGAANVYVVDDLAAYLIEQMRGLDSTAKDARATYADMLNDLHASRTEVAGLREHAARLEAELAELRGRLTADATA
jgi:ubiquinone biosynthesis protein UbiJ